MGELGPLLILAIFGWIMSAVGDARRKQQRGPRPPRVPPSQRYPRQPRPGRRATAAGTGADATQQEGSRLEQILREFEQALEQAQPVPRTPGPVATGSRGGWDAGEEVEERGSHDDDAQYEVESLERLENFERPVREDVALGADAEELVQRRIAWAEAQGRALGLADHGKFDARIRAPGAAVAAPAAAAPSDRLRRLRQAMVWREVLGPPVALRGMDREV